MEKKLIEERVRKAIRNGALLDWIRKDEKGKAIMYLEDVEKIIYGIFDEIYIDNLFKIKRGEMLNAHK